MTRLKSFRERLDMRQADLAGKLKVTQPCISMIERGRFEPSENLKQKISKVFGQPESILFPNEPEDD